MAERIAPENDPRTVDELFDAALGELDLDDEEEAYSFALSVLQFRSTREVLDHAVELTRSSDSDERELGVHVLSQLLEPVKAGSDEIAGRKPGWLDETLAVLTDLVETETDDDVLSSVAHGFGFRWDPRGVDPLLRLLHHDDADVRSGVVFALASCGYFRGENDPPLRPDQDAHNGRVVEALIEGAGDEDGDVRDWALFGLAQLTLDPPDDPERPGVRDTFAAHLDDEHEDARGEAVSALAMFGDPRAEAPLIELLEDEDAWPGPRLMQAAVAYASPALLPSLLTLLDDGLEDALLQEAIISCSPPVPDAPPLT